MPLKPPYFNSERRFAEYMYSLESWYEMQLTGILRAFRGMLSDMGWAVLILTAHNTVLFRQEHFLKTEHTSEASAFRF